MDHCLGKTYVVCYFPLVVLLNYELRHIIWRHNENESICQCQQQARHINEVEFLFFISQIGGQSSAAVTRPHGNIQDVGSNPAGARNGNQTLGTPLQKVAQCSGQDLSGRSAM